MLKRLPLTLIGIPLYPWLLALFPILHLYGANLGAVKDEEVFSAAVCMLAATAFIFLITQALVGNRYRTALIVSFLSLIFSLSGHIHESVLFQEPLLVWTGGVVILAALTMKELPDRLAPSLLHSATPGLNLIAIILALAQLPAIATYHFRDVTQIASPLEINGAPAAEATRQRLPDSATRPDIYYIIPDAYPSDAWLLEVMDFDNSGFTSGLRERGFIINDRGQSNYGDTLLSLASTLNMRYINRNPTPFSDKDFLHLQIADNSVARTLQKHGYNYVQLLSGYLVPSPTADLIRDFTPAGAVDMKILPVLSSSAESGSVNGPNTLGDVRYFYQRSFLSLYLDTTLLKVVGNALQAVLVSDAAAPYDMYAPERFLDTLDELDSIVAMPEATFTVVHLLKPHNPTTFDEQGQIIAPIYRPKPHEHLAELRFLNAKFLELVDSILNGSTNEPVIILQSDHGSTYGISTGGSRRIHFDAYSAYFLPDAFDVTVPRPFTFVNTFPLILNAVFGERIELQENRLVEMTHRARFEQYDVTETFGRWYD